MSSGGRLPSPPPAPEIQLTPDDQDAFGAPGSGHGEVDRHIVEENSRRRIHPGTKAAAIETGPPLIELSDINSPFALQEHLAALHHHYTQQGKQALTRAVALQIAQAPPMVEDQAWIYELCRFLLAECNKLIVGFLFDTPPCSASTCPEMRASEWQFLCAVHEQPKSCCAIDYCCHTLDWAANVVTDPRTFPSRLAPHTDGREELNLGKHAPPSSQTIAKSLVNVFRRVHRIFAHAWFQHRSVFWAVEAQSGLYLLFKVVCDTHRLLQGETYRLPPEAEGLDTATSPASSSASEQTGSAFKSLPLPRRGEEEDPLHPTPIGRSNTRRHIRGSPSTGSAVTTVIEADEEESAAASRGRLGGVRAKVSEVSPSRLEAHDESDETTSVPVIVEHVEDNEPSNVRAPTPPPDVDAAAESDDDAATTILHDDEADIGDGGSAGGEAEGALEGAPGDAAGEAGDASAAEAGSGSDSGKDSHTPDSSDQEHSSDSKDDAGDALVGEKEESAAAEAGAGVKQGKDGEGKENEAGTDTSATEDEEGAEGEDEKKGGAEADAEKSEDKVEKAEGEAQDEGTAGKKEDDAKVEGGEEGKEDAGKEGEAPN